MEFLKILLPVVTFIAGYLLSNLDRFRESRRKLRNMKTILFKEMSENYKLLNKVVPRDENDFSDPYLVAEFVQRSSFAVYDKYLDQLALLRTTELSKIYEACAMLKGLQGDVGAFLTASREDNSSPQAKENLRARATSLMVVAPKCHELMNAALGVFTESQPFLRAQEADRGSALDVFKQQPWATT